MVKIVMFTQTKEHDHSF